MPAVTSYRPGTPCWVDLATSDLDGAAAFYQGLFGWTALRDERPEAGGYTSLTLHDKPVAGMGPLQSEGQPVAWSAYVSVADADETLAKVTAAGGQVLLPTIDVFDLGRLAVLADPAGAVIGLWQPKKHIGAEVAEEPNTFCWAELNTRGVDQAKAFYRAVFGWAGVPSAADGGYVEWQLEGQGAGDHGDAARPAAAPESPEATSIGGLMPMDENWPADVPSHWMVYFAVTDTDAVAAKAEALGAKICVPPTDIPVGRFAIIDDPQGATFSIITLNPAHGEGA